MSPIESTAQTQEQYGTRDVSASFTLIDGYEYAGLPGTISGWGLDGWDAGDWPYVVFRSGRNKNGKWWWQVRVEGDVYTYRYDTEEAREAGLDAAIVWYWCRNPERYGFTESDVANIKAGRPTYHGRFSWHRLRQSQGETCPDTCAACAKEDA